MYADVKPCRVCGSAVELEPNEPSPPSDPVGPRDGYVGDGDSTPDRRVCTNEDCASHGAGGPEA